jgi:DNA-binding ferritin-like protein
MSAQTVPDSYTPHMPPGRDDAVRQLLQTAVALLVDLQLQAKQAHWNVVRRGFRSLHAHLDDLVDLLFNQTVVDLEKHAWLLEAEVAPSGTAGS